MEYSKYQKDFFREIADGTSSILLRARAGTGKTFSILKAVDLIPKDKKVILLAFNKSIATELQQKIPKHVTASTLHAFGARTVFMHFGQVKLYEHKVFNIAVNKSSGWNIDESKFSYAFRVSKLVDFMRTAMVYDDHEEISNIADRNGIQLFGEEILHAKEVLKASDKMSYDRIDFTDMIHIPASRNLKMKKFDYVFVDEVQDLNIAQQRMIQKIVNPRGGRVIAVGDDRQAIYAFSGADANSFDKMRQITAKVKEMPLNICYRCEKNIILEAQEIVEDIEYSETAGDGIVRDGFIEEINGDVFVICRNTKPLIQAFMMLLKRGIKANIKGREIGENIINIIKKTNQKTVVGLRKHLEVNRVKLKSKLLARGVVKIDGHPQMVEYVEKKDIIELLAEKFTTTNQLVKYIDSMFCDDEVPGVLLMTVHKSKGLEKDKVFFLCPELIPSKFAVTPEMLHQESNLLYVGITRARKELIYIRFPF